MQIKPKAIAQRFRKAYEASYVEAIADTESILAETLHLVEEQFPQMDTASIYRHLAYGHAAHDSNEPASFLTESTE
jgi:hypothetical protein